MKAMQEKRKCLGELHQGAFLAHVTFQSAPKACTKMRVGMLFIESECWEHYEKYMNKS